MLQFSLTNTVSCAEMSIWLSWWMKNVDTKVPLLQGICVFNILWKFLIFFCKVNIILLIDMLPQEVFPSLQYLRVP